jgi:hypothetical protein
VPISFAKLLHLFGVIITRQDEGEDEEEAEGGG